MRILAHPVAGDALERADVLNGAGADDRDRRQIVTDVNLGAIEGGKSRVRQSLLCLIWEIGVRDSDLMGETGVSELSETREAPGALNCKVDILNYIYDQVCQDDSDWIRFYRPERPVDKVFE
jgi:hypothetical protein